MKSGRSEKNPENSEGFEHIIRYEDGIKADFVLASCSVPVNYDIYKTTCGKPALVGGGQDDN